MHDLINLLSYAVLMLTLSVVVGYVGYYLARYIKTLKPRQSRYLNWERIISDSTRQAMQIIRQEREWETQYKGKNKASLLALQNILERTCENIEYEAASRPPRNNEDVVNMRVFYDAKLYAYRDIISEIKILMKKYE